MIGTAPLDLGDYQSVKRFSRAIQAAIHGHEDDSHAPHPMPCRPEDALTPEQLQTFDQWLIDDMPERDADSPVA
jgi:hypothetical protein